MANDDKMKLLMQTVGCVATPEIKAHHTEGDVDDRIFHAADKLVQYVRKREAYVTYHGPNQCSDRKPWAAYSHFHITVISDRRLGTDSNVVALHRKCATCHIPASQQTRFPASWANYLCQEPRVLWYTNPHALIGEFASWTLNTHIERNTPLPANRKRLFEETASTSTDQTNPENATHNAQRESSKTLRLSNVADTRIRIQHSRGLDQRSPQPRHYGQLQSCTHTPPF